MSDNDRTALFPTRLIIGDQRPDRASGGWYEHVSPVTGRAQAGLSLAGTAEVDEAVAVARAALAGWRRWDPVERRRVLMRFAQLIREHAQELSTIAALELGQPKAFTGYLPVGGAAWLEEAAGWADRLHGQASPLSERGVLEYTAIEPYGVVAALSTWNGSVNAFCMSVAAPLAAGCTVVAKPSELAPFSSLRAAELALEAGLPAGVLNVLVADVKVSQALVSHPGIDKITFTGSPNSARQIAAAAAPQLTPCVFELGGKSAALVFEDGDLDRALEVASALMLNAGQICTLGSRILVQRSVHEQFVERLSERVAAARPGDPFEEGVTMGPVISQAALDRILGMIGRARNYGTTVTGGQRIGGALSDGYFVAPTVVQLRDNTGELARDEVFGPVVGVQVFDDEDAAVGIANDTDYGLAGYVFTAEIGRAHRVAAALDTGNVGVNGGVAPAGPHLGFGGRRNSGYGRQGGLGGVMEFVSPKTVQIRL
ncbi:aldehyde dehydrogenase family protein [Kineosporia babensis]|uniref:Aldehyde dehydrogenase family protein n=1 Tax=Kineosporia babensis TaxID=499548 RepID=A0A9X1SVW3_9ACTN|nr:aldehyde dehydrogenase family protein [Kineosporia babensis]MCD5314412.1 aldehyde dehydrogenase family protein [Kineosporia babensis]